MVSIKYLVQRKSSGMGEESDRPLVKPLQGKAICGCCGAVFPYGPDNHKYTSYDEAQAALDKHHQTCPRKDHESTLTSKEVKKRSTRGRRG